MKSLALTTIGISALVVTASSRVPVFAQDTLAPVRISGFVDAYYSYNPAKPVNSTDALRNFDVADNQFVLSQAEVTLSRTAAPIGFRIDAAYGTASDMIQSGVQGTLATLEQAYATAAVPVVSGLSLDVGKFFTGMGYEVIPTKDNLNYSRSFSFAWAIPYYHVGVRASYAFTKSLTSTLMVVNGWNNATPNTMKTLHLCLLDAVTPEVSVGLNWIGGREEPDSISKSFRNIIEGIASVQATNDFLIALDLTYGSEPGIRGLSLWKAAVVYVKYQWTERFAIAIRGEEYLDPEGFTTGTTQDLSEVTSTLECRTANDLILRAEYRHDSSTATVFADESSPRGRREQDTFLFGVIVAF